MSEFRTETGKAVLRCKLASVPTRYVLHIDLGGRAVLIELLDKPPGLACDDEIEVVFEDGRALACQVLDDTKVCTVIGDGFRRAS